MSFKRGLALRAENRVGAPGPLLGRLISNWNSTTAMATANRHGAITHAFQPSFACQGFYWVQLCRVAGGKEAEDNSDQG